MDNQRLVTFATGEKCLLTLGLIISHKEPVGLKFPRTEISVSNTKFFFFFSFCCKDVLFLQLFLKFCIISEPQCTLWNRNGRPTFHFYHIFITSNHIIFYSFQIRPKVGKSSLPYNNLFSLILK